MYAKRDDEGDYIVTLTPEEAHVLIWGGYKELHERINHGLFGILQNIEDNEMTDEEYDRRFNDLNAVYKSLETTLTMSNL